MPLISFDGLRVPLEEVQDNPGRFTTRLERAKRTPGYAVCGYRTRSGETPLRLVVRRYGSLFHLARWPDDGHRHARGHCPFFAEPGPAEESPGRTHDAILDFTAALDELDAATRGWLAYTIRWNRWWLPDVEALAAIERHAQAPTDVRLANRDGMAFAPKDTLRFHQYLVFIEQHYRRDEAISRVLSPVDATHAHPSRAYAP